MLCLLSATLVETHWAAPTCAGSAHQRYSQGWMLLTTFRYITPVEEQNALTPAPSRTTGNAARCGKRPPTLPPSLPSGRKGLAGGVVV
jgi:hypothetical protein